MRIAKNLHVDFVLTAPDRIDCLWSPQMPARLEGQALRRYRAARDAFLRDIAAEMDARMLSVEL